MSDSDDNHSAPGIPAWQRDQKHTETEPQLEPEQQPTSQDAKDETPADDKLEVARRFLQDDDIKDAPRERKEEFLKTKGLTSSEIEELLGSSSTPEPVQEPAQTEPATAESTAPTTTTAVEPQSTAAQDGISLPRQTDNPPVITYPEFLTKPTRPPPLITVNGILNTLYAFAGVSTLVYGTSKFVVAPMVESLTEARAELHETTSQKLSKLIEKLEGTVSEIPTKKPAAAEPARDDAASASDFDDPSELFHRDIGTQTSFPSTPRLGAPGGSGNGSGTSADDKNATVCERHARKIADMERNARRLREACVSEAEDLANVKASMDVLKDDLVQLAYPPHREFNSGLYVYGPRSNEPDDEIKKAKDNIRRVKGVLLSTRNFPASVR